MPRQQKQRPQQPAPGIPTARPAVSPRPAVSTPGPPDHGDAIEALRTQIETLRYDMNARLDAMMASLDRLTRPVVTTPPAARAVTSEHSGAERHPAPARLRVGDHVYVPRLGGAYRVVEVAQSGQTFKVQAGPMRVGLRRDEVWALDDGDETERRSPRTIEQTARRIDAIARTDEIDLHGFSESDALVTLEIFLNGAFASHVPRVRIIHGKGNGILREAVRRELQQSHFVKSIETGLHLKGDEGVTIAHLDV